MPVTEIERSPADRPKRAGAALEVAASIDALLERGRGTALTGAAGLTALRAEEFLAELQASRSHPDEPRAG